MTSDLISFFDVFNKKHNMIGFDNFLSDIEKFNESFKENNFPPYNIYTKPVRVVYEKNKKESESVEEVHTFIDIACAGFKKEGLDISYNTKTNVLTVSGNADSTIYSEDDLKNKCLDNRTFYHKGIAERFFQNNWKLSDKLEYVQTTYENGILSIEFKDSKEKEEEIKKLEIK